VRPEDVEITKEARDERLVEFADAALPFKRENLGDLQGSSR